MTSLLISAVFLLAAPSEQPELRARAGDPQNPDYELVSTVAALKGATGGFLITDTITNGLADTSVAFTLRGGQKGVLPAAGHDGARAVRRMLTATRTTFRRVDEVPDGVTGRLTTRMEDFSLPANRWGEIGGWPQGAPGRRLEAALFNGGPEGRPLLRLTSEVGGSLARGYTVIYTVENRSAKPFKFAWAGLDGKVEAGKSFIKTEPAANLPTEEAGRAALDFGDKAEYSIRANLWSHQK